ncbi:hypothetical protein BJ875DRAFT_379490, partial [Amylocarpus encephaloides]
VIELVTLIIKGEIKNTKYILEGILFINLNYLIDSTLVPSNLNRYYRAYPKQLN